MQRNELQLWWKGLTPLWHLLMCWGLTDSLTQWGLCLLSFKMPAKNWAWNLGERGAQQGRQDKGPPSEVKLLNCLSACSQGLLRGRGAGRKQEGVSGKWRERDTQKIWERRKNGDSMNCLASSKGTPWNSITFCFFRTHPRLSFALWKIAWRPRIAVDHRILSEFLVEL